MLVLTRRVGEQITIGGNIEVEVVRLRGRQIQLGITAPAEVGIWRSELLNPDPSGTNDPANVDLRTRSNVEPLDGVLDRSEELHQAILDILSVASLDQSARSEASAGMCSLAFEHADAIRQLMGSACTTSAISLVRLQFEAVTRAMWLLYAAPNDQVLALVKELNGQSERGAKDLPTVAPMIAEIGKVVGTRAPQAAHEMLVRFKEVSLKALNSYVHAGIHALNRHVDGVPLPLAVQVQKNSNALLTMTGMTLAILTGDPAVTREIGLLQRAYIDCLPDLVV